VLGSSAITPSNQFVSLAVLQSLINWFLKFLLPKLIKYFFTIIILYLYIHLKNHSDTFVSYPHILSF
jgi:hypothetical protein